MTFHFNSNAYTHRSNIANPPNPHQFTHTQWSRSSLRATTRRSLHCAFPLTPSLLSLLITPLYLALKPSLPHFYQSLPTLGYFAPRGKKIPFDCEVRQCHCWGLTSPAALVFSSWNISPQRGTLGMAVGGDPVKPYRTNRLHCVSGCSCQICAYCEYLSVTD